MGSEAEIIYFLRRITHSSGGGYTGDHNDVSFALFQVGKGQFCHTEDPERSLKLLAKISTGPETIGKLFASRSIPGTPGLHDSWVTYDRRFKFMV